MYAIFRTIFFVYLTVVTISLLLPLQAGNEQVINDKVAHLLIFFFMSWLIARAYPQVNFIRTLAPAMAIYGLSMELLQAASGYRHFSLLDFVADITGIFIFVLTRLMYKFFRNQAAKI